MGGIPRWPCSLERLRPIGKASVLRKLRAFLIIYENKLRTDLINSSVPLVLIFSKESLKRVSVARKTTFTFIKNVFVSLIPFPSYLIGSLFFFYGTLDCNRTWENDVTCRREDNHECLIQCIINLFKGRSKIK